MSDTPLYDDGSSVEPFPVTLSSGNKVTGTGFLPWGVRRRISARNDGTFEGFLDALVKVWCGLEDTTTDILVRDPKSGSIVKLELTEDVIDGLVRPCLKPEHVSELGLALGKHFYPETYAWDIFSLGAEGESSPPVTPEESSGQLTEQPKPRKRGGKNSASA